MGGDPQSQLHVEGHTLYPSSLLDICEQCEEPTGKRGPGLDAD